jgi:hypothetical protein
MSVLPTPPHELVDSAAGSQDRRRPCPSAWIAAATCRTQACRAGPGTSGRRPVLHRGVGAAPLRSLPGTAARCPSASTHGCSVVDVRLVMIGHDLVRNHAGPLARLEKEGLSTRRIAMLAKEHVHDDTVLIDSAIDTNSAYRSCETGTPRLRSNAFRPCVGDGGPRRPAAARTPEPSRAPCDVRRRCRAQRAPPGPADSTVGRPGTSGPPSG